MLDSVSIACRSSVRLGAGLGVGAGDLPEHSNDLVEVVRAFEGARRPHRSTPGTARPRDRRSRSTSSTGPKCENRSDRAARALSDPFDRGDRELEIVVGRWSGRTEHPRIGRVDAERVPREDGAGRRSPRAPRDASRGPACRDGLEVPTAELDQVAVAERSDPLGRNGFDRPEQRRHRLRPVDRGHAREQARGIGEMPCAAFVHPHRRVREAFGDAPHTSGVVEMDVRHHDVREVGAPDPETFETAPRRVRTRSPVRSRRSPARPRRAGTRRWRAGGRRRTCRSR